ncbi:hypothetical protein GYMLUDRAFT_36571 [Collybiopsis luxurians FD-317 M1]|nr:hypothetical protein GYMLUDRAFT_36571 [Collybiopsis luxurians FD-317 M1]
MPTWHRKPPISFCFQRSSYPRKDISIGWLFHGQRLYVNNCGFEATSISLDMSHCSLGSTNYPSAYSRLCLLVGFVFAGVKLVYSSPQL